jgi:hypothetical protein
MLRGFSLGSYTFLLDYTGRLFRDGKAVISAELSGILQRLGSTAADWQARLEKSSFLSVVSGQLLRAIAARLGYTTWQIWAGARRDKGGWFFAQVRLQMRIRL